MAKEMVCPYCGRREPFKEHKAPLNFSETAPSGMYKCPCGAVASPSTMTLMGPGSCSREEEDALEGASEEPWQNGSDTWTNIVTETDPPLRLHWTK